MGFNMLMVRGDLKLVNIVGLKSFSSIGKLELFVEFVLGNYPELVAESTDKKFVRVDPSMSKNMLTDERLLSTCRVSVKSKIEKGDNIYFSAGRSSLSMNRKGSSPDSIKITGDFKLESTVKLISSLNKSSSPSGVCELIVRESERVFDIYKSDIEIVRD